MNFKKGDVIKFEPTKRGRERAAEFNARFPIQTAPVLRYPHHVCLAADFELRPVEVKPEPAKPAKKS